MLTTSTWYSLAIGFGLGILFLKLKHYFTRQVMQKSAKEEVEEKDVIADDDDDLVPQERNKMVLVVRQDLKMGAGKMCAQCSHAALGAYRHVISAHQQNPKNVVARKNLAYLRQWRDAHCAKVALSIPDLEQMYKNCNIFNNFVGTQSRKKPNKCNYQFIVLWMLGKRKLRLVVSQCLPLVLRRNP